MGPGGPKIGRKVRGQISVFIFSKVCPVGTLCAVLVELLRGARRRLQRGAAAARRHAQLLHLPREGAAAAVAPT